MEQNLVIANGATASATITLPRLVTQGTFQIPAAFTGANVTPKMSNDNATFTAVGSAISVAANGTYAIPAGCFAAKYLQLVSASAEGAERTLIIFLRE